MAIFRVLVVDDEAAVLDMVSRALAAVGYEVQAVESPTRALELAEASPPFDLVVSDVVMPEMSGLELVQSLTQSKPNTAIVLMSGYVDIGEIPKGAAFIRKPFKLADLYSIVKQKLLRLDPGGST